MIKLGKWKKKNIVIGVVLALVVIGIVYLIYQQFGKYHLLKDWVAGDERYLTVLYEDEEYRYQDDFINILCLGIDKEEPMDTRNDEDNSVGQSDAIFLVSLNIKEDTIQLLSIPRDTIVDLEMYDGNGNYLGQRAGQITLQYAYADGQEKSADLVTQRVAELLNYIPIHGYAAINLESLLRINDVIDGVDITMDEDYTLLDPSFVEGATIHLEGEKLYQYIHGRDITVRGSSYTRINRLKQYMMAVYEKVKVELKEDMSFVVPLLTELEEDMIVSLTNDEMLYVLGEALACEFSEENVYTLPGEPVRGEVYEEYYPDRIKIAEMMLELFYETK